LARRSKFTKRLGPGLLESAYGACLAYELRQRGFQVCEEKPVPLIYGDVKLDCGFRADLLVNGLVVVELKAKTEIHPVDKAQTLSHLRLLSLRVGLLINFHEVRLVDGVQRIVNGY
jgi:GxxExxY protein